MKICTKCKEKKVLKEFSFKNKVKGIRRARCRQCMSEYDKSLYKNSNRKNTLKLRHKNHVKYLKDFLIRYKKLKTCSKCNDKRHYVLDFHHLYNKKYKISDMVRSGFGINTLKQEIRKCTLLCANCHREVHYLER